MPDIPGGYAPPGVYTRTLFDSPIQSGQQPRNIPVLIGTGNEILSQSNLGVVRGSSASVDQRVVDEDETGRALVSETPLTLGSFNGVITKFQVRNFPIVTGEGSGTTATNSSSISVTINGSPTIILGIDGATGILELAEAPVAGDLVRATYYFNRTDTSTTDDVSSQVTAEAAILNGAFGVAATFAIDAANNTLILSVNGGANQTVSLTPGAAVAPVDVAAAITANITGVTAAVFTNNFGNLAISLTATQSIKVATADDGSTANALLGFFGNQETSRNASFKVFNTPIVDGTNGGITTTEIADVTVKVDNVQVTVTEVNGAAGTVTLALPPASGSTVTIEYFFNTWQDTFDYLAHIGITEITRVSLTNSPFGSPGAAFTEDVDWILKDDVIVWGTSSLISAGTTTAGSTAFGPTQVSTTLVDNRMFMAETASVLEGAVESRFKFKLPEQPTTGNGRNNPLGTVEYNKVANNRFELPTNNPNLVIASVGFDLVDAINRGTVVVNSVDHTTSTITLDNPVEEGEKVFATFYYTTMIDETYTLTCAVAGVSGVGSYGITNKAGSSVFAATFGAKGAALATIPLEFPSGSELFPDAILVGTTGTGPVDEVVTVTFAVSDETPAKYTAPGLGPYSFDAGNSEVLAFNFDATGNPGNVSLDSPSGGGRLGCFAILTSDEIAYEADQNNAAYVINATNDSLTLNVDGETLSVTTGAAPAGTLANYVAAINAAAVASDPSLTGTTAFGANHVVAAGEYDQMTFSYTGDVSGAIPGTAIIIPPATYPTPTDLATAITLQLAALPFLGVATCDANAAGQLVFTLDQGVMAAPFGDAEGYLEFVTGAAPTQDLAIVAGFATDAASGDGAKIYGGPIARRFTVAAASTHLNNDRLILRNRVWPGATSAVAGNLTHHNSLSQCVLRVESGSGLANCGFEGGEEGEAAYGATIKAASVSSQLITWERFAGAGVPGQPQVTFFDGTDPAGLDNRNITIRVGNQSDTFTLTGTPTGTATPIGSAVTLTSVVGQINTLITASGALAGLVTCHQEGAGIRLVATGTRPEDQVEVIPGTGDMLATLGFTGSRLGTATLVSAGQVVSALNHDLGGGAWSTAIMMGWATPSIAASFQAVALAKALKNDGNTFNLFVQSQSLGAGSIVLVLAATGLREGTGFLAQVGDNAVGEVAEVGYFVTSSNPAGSGSGNTSRINPAGTGVGQDGHVGQTYTDTVTGLRFTVLPRPGAIAYPTGATSTFTLRVSNTVVTNANTPFLLPGIEMTVANTVDVAVGDTALVNTFRSDGNEPSIGEAYFVSYDYTKQDYSVSIFRKLSDIEAAFGAVSPNNPLSLAAYLMFLNGAVQIGIKQIKKDAGSNTASEAAFLAGIDSLEGDLPGGITPNLLIPLTTASTTLLAHLALHCDVQSSIRYKSERTAIVGFAAGTQPSEAGLLAKATGSTRIRVIYPDIAIIPITDALGTTTEFLVDGRYMAAAMAGNRVALNRDVATPWTGAQLVGFSSLGRNLDAVQANQVAVNGVTVLEGRPPFLRVRHGLTTDMTNVLTKTPTVIQIADEVQQSSRSTLDPYIGTKFLGNVTNSVETRLTALFKRLKSAQIIAGFTGISVTVDPNDPTSLNVEAFYQPVFPLLYIVLTFNVRTSV